MFTDTALVAFVSMGSTGVVSAYDAELVVASNGAPVVAGDDTSVVVKENGSVVKEEGAPVFGEGVIVAPAVEFGKAGQTKSPTFSA